MKDKLGREIRAGDTVAVIDIDCSLAWGPVGRSYLETYKVDEVASFGIAVTAKKGPRVYTTPDSIVIVEMNRQAWGQC